MIEEFEYKGHTIRFIDSEPEVESPREYDPLGIMVTFHRNVDFNDMVPPLNSSDFNGWDEMKEHIINKLGAVVILPVYMLDHSGQSLSVKPFSCPFDSGQLGFIYTTREKMLTHRNFKHLTKKLKDEAEQELIGEIETLDQWIRGEAYGFVIDPIDDNDEEGAIEEYGGGYWDTEMAKATAIDTVDGLHAQDEELELIRTMPAEDLPKYINHKWKFTHVSNKAYKERIKCLPA